MASCQLKFSSQIKLASLLCAVASVKVYFQWLLTIHIKFKNYNFSSVKNLKVASGWEIIFVSNFLKQIMQFGRWFLNTNLMDVGIENQHKNTPTPLAFFRF